MTIKIFKFIAISALGLGAYILLGSSCVPKNSIPVSGFLFGRPISITVDIGLAGLMLTNPQDNKVQNLFTAYNEKPLDTRTLSDIASNYSIDVATFYFCQKEYQKEQVKGY